jgi:serine protease
MPPTPARFPTVAAIATLIACLGMLLAGSSPAAASVPTYVPGEVVVGYKANTDVSVQAAAASAVGARAGETPAPRVRVLHVRAGQVRATIAKLRHQPGVAYAAPNPIAHASEATLPDDPGVKGFPGGLAATQWNFYDPVGGVNALAAWTNLQALTPGRAPGYGVRIAVIDTGVAYRNYGKYKKSPDFGGTRFVAPYDFVANTRFPVDASKAGHGTHVAGTIAEATNNGIGVTGLAYGATIMPVRVLDSGGYGDAATIAKGIRYAAAHGAKVINMSLEFSTSVKSTEIPDIIGAISYAHSKGAVVVASSGNEGEAQVAYPARTGLAISVGATTDDACLAIFSNDGVGLDIVAPGGGNDANLPRDLNCRAGHIGRHIYQETYTKAPGTFGLPPDFEGTSMAAPHVSATAALIIASKLLGANPTPNQVECRLKGTARQLGLPGPNRVYGYGLVDAGAATSPAVQTPQCAAPNAKP